MVNVFDFGEQLRRRPFADARNPLRIIRGAARFGIELGEDVLPDKRLGMDIIDFVGAAL